MAENAGERQPAAERRKKALSRFKSPRTPQAATMDLRASYQRMNRFLSILLFAAMSAAQTTPAPAIPIDQQNAAKARALLDQAIEALGGNAYLNIEDMTQEGRSYSFHHGEPSGAGALFWRLYRFPDKERIELTKKRDVAYVYRGDQGFEITYKGVRADDPKSVADFVRRRKYSLEWVLRKWLHEPGMALFYDGPAVAAERDTQEVTLVSTHNESVDLYFDTSSHLPVKKSFSWRDPTDKEKNIEEEVYDNYKPVEGVMTPFSVTRFYNGDMAGQRFLNSIRYNTGLNDSLFNVSVTYDSNLPAPRK
jgi:hypothetical protein